MNNHKSPQFIGIGAQKAGTSWLYKNLAGLPSFSLPVRKELHYFDRSANYPSPNLLTEEALIKRLSDLKWFMRSLKHLSRLLFRKDIEAFKWYKNYYFSNYTEDWYLNLFSSCQGITGEVTPAYSILEEKEVLEMSNLFEELRLIFMVRNPIDRAWSSYKYKYKIRDYNLDNNQVTKAIDFFYSDEQLLRGNYIQTIDRYLNVFGEGKLILGFYDAIIENPKELLKGIIQFLGGEPNEVSTLSELHKKINTSTQIKMPFIIEEELKKMYSSQITELSRRYGGYFIKWKNEVEGIQVPYESKSTLIL